MMTDTLFSVPSNAAPAAALPNRAPAEVRWALKLLWLSLAISLSGLLYFIYKVYGTRQPTSGYVLITLMFPFAWGILSAFLNVMIAYRKNWARIMQLAITTAILTYQLGYLPMPTDVMLIIRAAVVYGLDCAAMYLLFITSGRRWFSPKSTGAEE